MMRGHRWVASLLVAVLVHGAWATARIPCAGVGGAPTARAGAAHAGAGAAAPEHDAHAAHHAPASQSPTPADGPSSPTCPGLMTCALAVALPVAPTVLGVPTPHVAVRVPPVIAWREGPSLTLDPPPPKRA